MCQQWQILISVSLLMTGIVCMENDQPVIFLISPNFIPQSPIFHQRPNNGPVVFPPTPPEDNPDGGSGVVTIGSGNIGHPVDEHPYPRVAGKYKYKIAGRFNEQDNHINPRVYEALSSHAAKVLSEPPSQLGKDYTLSSLSNQKKLYAFSYKVVDHLTGDDFSHTQSQNAQATNGEYRVKLPDGRVQIVSYVADKNGYKADVKYSSSTKNELSHHKRLQIPKIQQPIPHTYDYQQYEEDTPQILYPSSQDYDQQSYPKSIADYAASSPKHVDIYPNNVDVNKVATYVVSSTAAPFLLKNVKNPAVIVVSTTAAPTLEGYSQVYVNTPKFKIVHNQPHHDAYGK